MVRMVALCPACHEVKHYGRAQVIGHGDAALAHLQRVNGWDAAEAEKYVATAFDMWDQRNLVAWTLDLSLLRSYGVMPPTDAEVDAGRWIKP